MSELLIQYVRIAPTTWVYLSSFLAIGLFFKFNRLWSVRNLDLVLLVLLAPGLLMVLQGQADQRRAPTAEESQFLDGTPDGGDVAQPPPVAAAGTLLSYEGDAALLAQGAVPETPDLESLANSADETPPHIAAAERMEAAGYIWLFAVSLLLMVRLLVDPNMVRRPLLDPNLTTGGLIFIGCSLFVFQMANVITGSATEDDLRGPQAAESLFATADASSAPTADGHLKYGPGLAILHTLPAISTRAVVNVPENLSQTQQQLYAEIVTAKTMAILANLAIVIGIVVIGYRHFDNFKMGVGAAALYLMLPYMAEMTGRVNHAVPGALLVWAVVCYRRPLLSGMFLGLAAGVIYYPFFLLPLWMSFYWQRGMARFLGGFASMLLVLTGTLLFGSANAADFWLRFQAMFGLHTPAMGQLEGIWRVAWDPAYRIPIIATFIALSGTFALWPARKHLGTLISCTAVIMVAAQFWDRHEGGMLMAWYLPLLLLTVFRPNLEDRIAVAVLDKGHWPRLAKFTRAA